MDFQQLQGKAAERILGYSRFEVVDQSLGMLALPDDSAFMAFFINRSSRRP